MIWLTGQLAPDFKTIADFRKDNGKAIGEVNGKGTLDHFMFATRINPSHSERLTTF